MHSTRSRHRAGRVPRLPPRRPQAPSRRPPPSAAAACGTAASHGAAPATPRGCAACARSRRLRRQSPPRARGRGRPGPDGSGCPCVTSGFYTIAAERQGAVNRLAGRLKSLMDALARSSILRGSLSPSGKGCRGTRDMSLDQSQYPGVACPRNQNRYRGTSIVLRRRVEKGPKNWTLNWTLHAWFGHLELYRSRKRVDLSTLPDLAAAAALILGSTPKECYAEPKTSRSSSC